MGNNPPEYWGYLVKADKSPSIIFELLLCGIANYINRQIAPWDVNCLTPTKLAAFYRLVGGDYDPLFLETPKASLSFIYQSMGCFHTLQPEKDPYLAPSIPALTIQGFVRWQTVQLLLEPDEHASFLQNAVKRLEIINPADGIPFPDRLPREALPSRPDPEMIQWHGGVAENLRLDSHLSDVRDLPPWQLAQRGDVPTESPSASSYERRFANDTTRYVTHPRQPPPFRPPPSIKVPRSIDAPPIGNPQDPHPRDLERRWSSTSDLRSPNTSRGASERSASNVYLPQNNLDRSHPRSPSTVSTSSISSSSSSSLTTSSASLSPRLHHRSHRPNHPQHGRRAPGQGPYHYDRRHSSHGPYSPREAANGHNIQVRLPPLSDGTLQRPPKLPGSSSTALNKQWGDSHNTTNPSQRPVDVHDQITIRSYTEPQWRSNDYRDTRVKSGGRSTSPVKGVGGRKYAAEGTILS
ncbi:MAG: hypothetical protein Q9213_002831 [Squamulea squamosa]